MVDGKVILDALLGAASVGGKQQSGATGGGLGDILGQVLGGETSQPQAGQQAGGSGIGDLLGQVLGGGASQPRAGQQSGGGIGDLLGQVLGGGASQPRAGQQSGGGIGDLLGQVLGGGASQPQAGQQSGGGIGDLLGQVLGGGASQQQAGGGLIGAIKDAVTNNPGLTQAALAGVAGLVLSGGSRGLASGAAKLGGIALIGGLAYKALKSFQNAAPAQASAANVALPSPENYTPVAASNDGALKLVRAMIAAAMADGVLDAEEQKKILGQMSQGALTKDQQVWLQGELARPASAKQVAQGVDSVQEAVEVYAAARIVIEPDSEPNRKFLDTLAKAMTLPEQLANEIDMAVDGVKVDNAG